MPAKCILIISMHFNDDSRRAHYKIGMWLSNLDTARMYSRLNEREIGFELDNRNVLKILLE